jgi:aminopeptidase-like protein
MSTAELVDGTAAAAAREDMTGLMTELVGMYRSITGDGVRETLARVAKDVPVAVHEVPSGTAVLDWTVPPEWNVRDAYVADRTGHRVIDLHASPLHLVGYSVPVRATMTLDELRPHLHTLPEHPEWVPYRTSYYTPGWGFCLSQRHLDAMDDGPYDVLVDTTLEPGFLTYGECVLPGEQPEEVLVSTHVCHPAMANDNLTGIAVATALARLLAGTTHRYTYRLLLLPGTIGSLTWLAGNPEVLPRVRHGVVLTGLGGPGPLVWKRTRHGRRAVDRAAEHVVGQRDGEVRDYSPWGYDERQYNAPGFDLPVGRLTRTPHGEYPEYHTSADDLSFVSADNLVEALAAVLELLDVLEHDAVPVRCGPPGEPQLGRRGLYPGIGGHSAQEQVLALLWAAGCADGEHSLLDVARRAGLPFAAVRRAAVLLAENGLLELRDLA